MKLSARPGQRGQAHVEAALVLPLTLVFCLTLLQLASVQQARLLAEYGAFCAARAGIVWNGDNERMRDAAFFALLPSLGRTDSAAALGTTSAWAHRMDLALANAGFGRTSGSLADGFPGAALLGLVRVDTVLPRHDAALDEVWKLQGGPAWTELDFDGVDAFAQTPDAESHYATGAPDPAEATLRDATVLAVRVRYLYELRIPLANRLLFLAWYAANARARLSGPLEASREVERLRGSARGIASTSGFPLVTREEMDLLWSVSVHGLPGLGRRFFLPLPATCSMRMQSNVYRRWMLHEGGAPAP